MFRFGALFSRYFFAVSGVISTSNVTIFFSFLPSVALPGLEPGWPEGQRILSPPCLPFHQSAKNRGWEVGGGVASLAPAVLVPGIFRLHAPGPLEPRRCLPCFSLLVLTTNDALPRLLQLDEARPDAIANFVCRDHANLERLTPLAPSVAEGHAHVTPPPCSASRGSLRRQPRGDCSASR